MLQYKDGAVSSIEDTLNPPAPSAKPNYPDSVHDGGAAGEIAPVPQPKKIIKPFNRQILFPAGQLESEKDVDEYVDKIRNQLKQLLKSCDGIKIK